MKKIRMLYLVIAVLVLCAGCSRHMQNAMVNEEQEEPQYTYMYQEGERFRLVTERRLKFVFPDQTTMFMSVGEKTGGRIICEFEQDTEERVDNINLGVASAIQEIYVCCEEGDFILAVVWGFLKEGYDMPPQTTFISLSTKEQLEVSGGFMYEREGLCTKTEGSLGMSMICQVTCGEHLTTEETAEISENRYMTKRPMAVLLGGEEVQADSFLNTDAYMLIPAGTMITITGFRSMSDMELTSVWGYYIKAELTDTVVTGWFLLNIYDRLVLQDAALTTVLTTDEREQTAQICSADVMTGSWMYDMVNSRLPAGQNYKLLIVDDGGYIYTNAEMLKNSDTADAAFEKILSEYKDMTDGGLSQNVYSDYQIVDLPEGADGVSADMITMEGLGRTILAVTCTYEDGSTTTQFYTDFLGQIVPMHAAEQGADGALVRTKEVLGLPVEWEQRWDMENVLSDDEDIRKLVFSEGDVPKNNTVLRQGRLAFTQNGYTSEYICMGADLLVRVK